MIAAAGLTGVRHAITRSDFNAQESMARLPIPADIKGFR